jgi:hypothetical protein
MKNLNKTMGPVLDQDRILAVLEPEQLAEGKKHLIARRRLKGSELWVLWSLRIYLLFMIAVVVYQLWTGIH